MLKTLFLFCFLLSCSMAFSQTPFEGKISYKLAAENEHESGTIEVLYGNQKIKGSFKKNSLEFNDHHVILIDFLKGIIYDINDSTKSYTAKSLKNKPDMDFISRYNKSGIKKNILGQTCSSFSLVDTTNKGEFFGDMEFIFWYADSLYFIVSEEYLNSDDMIIFTNGKNIGMGMTMKTEDLGKNTFFNLEPVKIEAMPLADSLFELPAGYVLKKTGEQQPGTGLQKEESFEIKLSEIKSDGPPPLPPPPKKKKKGKS